MHERGEDADGRSPQPSPPILCITCAATTEEKTSTDPIDRSIPDGDDDEGHANPENGPDGNVLRDK